MSYIDNFSSQWDNLKADFSVKLNSLSEEQIKSKTLNDWYHVRCYRWNSISEAEGMILEQEENPVLKKELISALESFRFEEVKSESVSFPVIPAIIGAAAAIAAAVVSKYLLLLSTKYAVIICLAVLAIMLFTAVKSMLSKKKTASARLRREYILQLENYGSSLLNICNKYCK